jgi:hypothetical protein
VTFGLGGDRASYRAAIVRLETGWARGRLLVPPLAGLLVASSCTTLTSADGAAGPFVEPVHTVGTALASPPAVSALPSGELGDPVTPIPSSSPPATAVPTIEAEPSLTPLPTPRVKVVHLRPRPRRGPFSVDLYERGDFVHQQTKDWCVAASTQTMLNIIRRGRADRTRETQARLYQRGRRLSPNKRKLGPIGVDLVGWAELLERNGGGRYIVDGARTRKASIRKAARALRMTGRPVGLVTWRGAHSWVMSGFRATADPAMRRGFEVTAVTIEDVWYPYVSTIWGASRPPGSLVPVAALAEDYLPYRRPRARWPDRDGRFMLILPVLPPNTVAR